MSDMPTRSRERNEDGDTVDRDFWEQEKRSVYLYTQGCKESP